MKVYPNPFPPPVTLHPTQRSPPSKGDEILKRVNNERPEVKRWALLLGKKICLSALAPSRLLSVEYCRAARAG